MAAVCRLELRRWKTQARLVTTCSRTRRRVKKEMVLLVVQQYQAVKDYQSVRGIVKKLFHNIRPYFPFPC